MRSARSSAPLDASPALAPARRRDCTGCLDRAVNAGGVVLVDAGFVVLELARAGVFVLGLGVDPFIGAALAEFVGPVPRGLCRRFHR